MAWSVVGTRVWSAQRQTGIAEPFDNLPVGSVGTERWRRVRPSSPSRIIIDTVIDRPSLSKPFSSKSSSSLRSMGSASASRSIHMMASTSSTVFRTGASATRPDCDLPRPALTAAKLKDALRKFGAVRSIAGLPGGLSVGVLTFNRAAQCAEIIVAAAQIAQHARDSVGIIVAAAFAVVDPILAAAMRLASRAAATRGRGAGDLENSYQAARP